MSADDDPLPDSSALPPDSVAALTSVLSKALRGLGNAGKPVAASKLGGRAWWILKEHAPREAERINGVMHYLARLDDEDAPATTAGTNTASTNTASTNTADNNAANGTADNDVAGNTADTNTAGNTAGNGEPDAERTSPAPR